MKVPREQIERNVRQWLAYADDDLRFARAGLAFPGEQPPPYHLIAYHAQQCAEKCLKAYLVFHGVDFPRTHNISTLLELCNEYAEWALELREAEVLTDYAVTARYPGDVAEVAESDAQHAIAEAERVRTQVRFAFRESGMELA